jgi:hypothetical protein
MAERWGLPIVAWPRRLRPNYWDGIQIDDERLSLRQTRRLAGSELSPPNARRGIMTRGD